MRKKEDTAKINKWCIASDMIMLTLYVKASATPCTGSEMCVPDGAWVPPVGVPRANHLVDVGKHLRDTTIQGIVRRAAPDCEHGISTECGFCQDALKGHIGNPFFIQLAFDAVNHVLEIRRTSCTRVDSESVSGCAVPSRF